MTSEKALAVRSGNAHACIVCTLYIWNFLWLPHNFSIVSIEQVCVTARNTKGWGAVGSSHGKQAPFILEEWWNTLGLKSSHFLSKKFQHYVGLKLYLLKSLKTWNFTLKLCLDTWHDNICFCNEMMLLTLCLHATSKHASVGDMEVLVVWFKMS